MAECTKIIKADQAEHFCSLKGLGKFPWLAIVLFSLPMAFVPNALLVLACLWTLPVLLFLTWRKDEPAIIPFIVLFQWLQISLKTFRYTLSGLPIPNVSDWDLPCELEKATWIMLFGLIVLTAGILVGRGKNRKYIEAGLRHPFNGEKESFFLFWYIIFMLVTMLFDSIKFLIPGISQILVAIFSLKWVFLFCFAILTFKSKKRKNWIILICCVLFEIFIGFLGYFSAFRMVLQLMAIAGITVISKVKFKYCAMLGSLMAVTIYLGLLWTSVKADYRNALTQELHNKRATISVSARLSVLDQLIDRLKLEDLKRSVGIISSRLEEIDFMGYALNYVPQVIPHQNGHLLKKAILHVLRPRLLFPNKEALDDSADTNYYSGVKVAGADQGVSIGMGYMTYCYIDFGEWGMYLPIFFLGVLIGFIYRLFCLHINSRLLGQGCCVIILLGAAQVETSLPKMLGGIVSSSILMAIFCFFIFPLMKKFLLLKKNDNQQIINHIR